MKNIRLSRCYYVLLSCMLFGSPLVLATSENNVETNQVESQQHGELYICFDENMSDIAKVIYEIAALDENIDSPVQLLKRYLENGYVLGLHDEIIQVLEYANAFVDQLPNTDTKRTLTQRLDSVIEQVLEGALTMDEDAVRRSHSLRLLTIDERILVVGKAIFKSDVIIDKKLRVHGKARFYKDAQFKDNVTVDGTLSLTDAVAGCNLTVGCNTILTSSTDATHGNIMKNGNRFVHNFGIDNTFIGINSGNFTTIGIGENVGVGVNTLTANALGANNTAVGNYALISNTDGNNNTAIGISALTANTTANDNTAVGRFSLLANTTGTRNVAVGSGALQQTVTGTDNTAIGYNAGNATGSTAASNNIFIGSNAGSSNTGAQNVILIGNVGGAGFTNRTIIGTSGTQTSCFIHGIRGVNTGIADAIPVLIDSAGQLGTVSSSKRFKHSIQQMVDESAAILKLNPVSFVYKADESQTRQFGLIAEEVDAIFPRLVIRDKDGSPFTVRYEVLPVLLLNEVKKLVDKVATMDEALAIVQQKLAEYTTRS